MHTKHRRELDMQASVVVELSKYGSYMLRGSCANERQEPGEEHLNNYLEYEFVFE